MKFGNKFKHKEIQKKPSSLFYQARVYNGFNTNEKLNFF